jgi:HD-GYP domain-containing protein (c-di-GMP phosphodiesterase class II)
MLLARAEMTHCAITDWSLSELRDHLRARWEQLNVSREVDLSEALRYLIGLPVERFSAEAADALTYLARAFREEGRLTEGLQAASHARRWAAAADDKPVLYRARGTESDLLTDLGMFAESAVARVDVWSLARAMGDVYREICVIGNVGITVSSMGHWKAAASYYERARELAEKHGFPDFEYHSRSNLAGCAVELGDAASGFAALAKFDTEAPETRLDAQLAFGTHASLAELHLLVNDIDAARVHAEKSAQFACLLGTERATCYAKARIGLVDVKSGAIERGLVAVLDALAFAKRALPGDVSYCLRLCIEAYEAAGDSEKALEFLHELVDWKKRSLDAALSLLEDKRSTEIGTAQGIIADIDDQLLAKTRSLSMNIQDRSRLLIETAINAEIAVGFDLYRTFRVAKLARCLAADMGWEGKRIELLRLGAQLYNIGMLAIPTRLVQRAEELSLGERDVFYEHTRIGAKLLRRSKLRILDTAALIAEQHHERFDGSGFPAGLCSEHIVEEARIVAVCDAFDTMTHQSLSRATPLTTDAALAEIRKDSGTRFDPLIVDAFDRWIRRELPKHDDLDAYLAEGAGEYAYVRARARMERLLVETQ